jgi:recombinational DNA repair ATPase RecF
MTFDNPNKSFTWFIQSIYVTRFRHIVNLNIKFTHPITAIAGVNRSGKTSLLLLMACSHENFLRPDATSSSIGIREWLTSTILTARRQLSWPVEAGNEFNALLA